MKRVLQHSVVVVMGLVACTGCASRAPMNVLAEGGSTHLVSRTVTDEPPGVVRQIWEEPQIEVIQVPPGLDPEGHVYRPAHQAVVEVKPGRWRYYKVD